MKNLYQVFATVLLFTVLTSCSTGYKAYKHGDYYTATLNAIERLRAKPNNKKAQFVLQNAYPMAQKTAQREIDNALLRNEIDKYDIVVWQYERLNSIANNIYSCPKAYELIPNPAEYQAEIGQAKRSAAAQSYDLGIKALNFGTIEQARIAYNYFVRANQYVPGYSDVLAKIEESLYHATLRVIVETPVTAARYQISADFFSNNLIAEISRQNQNRFIRFYSYDEAKSIGMRDPHQYLVLNFEDYTIGSIRETKTTSDVKRDSVVVGTVDVEGKKYNAYNTVTAKYTLNRRELTSGGVLSVRFIDAVTGRVIQHKNFAGEYVWFTTWANFTGDDRALSTEQKRLVKQEPQMPPAQQDLFIEFTKPIYSQVVTYVRSFYRN